MFNIFLALIYLMIKLKKEKFCELFNEKIKTIIFLNGKLLIIV